MTVLALAQPGGFEQHLLQVFDGAAVLPVALLVAGAVGAVHGLAPGHGKSITAAYLVGTRASGGHALALAGIVAVMHTASVFVLAMVWWLLVGDGPVAVGAVTRGAQLVVALLVLALGLVITHRRWRERRSPHRHGRGPASQAVPWSWPGLAGIASVGGLLPSPSAFLVLISGLLTGRVALALTMVVAFGIGLAATVLASGMLTVAGRDWLTRHHSRDAWTPRALDKLPLMGAAGVLVGGVVLCVVALTGVLAA